MVKIDSRLNFFVHTRTTIDLESFFSYAICVPGTPTAVPGGAQEYSVHLN